MFLLSEHHPEDQMGSMLMLDLHIEGAAPVTLLVRDESRSTRSTSMNKDESLDLDLIEAENDNNNQEEPTEEEDLAQNDHLFSRQPTTSIDETDTTTTELRANTTTTTGNGTKKISSLALQIVDVDSQDSEANKEPLTLAEEMASFEYIDELAASVTSTSSFSDFGMQYFSNFSGCFFLKL